PPPGQIGSGFASAATQIFCARPRREVPPRKQSIKEKVQGVVPAPRPFPFRSCRSNPKTPLIEQPTHRYELRSHICRPLCAPVLQLLFYVSVPPTMQLQSR